MDTSRTWGLARSWVWLAIGAVCFAFVGWKFNVAAAAWIAPVFLIRFFRDQKRWFTTLPAILLLAVGSFIQMNGGWDLDPWMIYTFSFLRPAAFFFALYVDRALARRLPAGAATLVYPAVYLLVDYLISFTPLGSIMSVSATQFGMPGVTQLASLTGICGIGFLIGWIAAVINHVWENGFEISKTRRLAGLGALILVLVVGLGGARFALTRPSSPTVKVGSVAVAHPRDYWAWIDAGTPRAVVVSYAGELAGIEEQLFAQSERAVAAGAKIVFWSEGNVVLTEDNEKAFMDRASEFAVSHGVYFAPAMVVLRFGQTISDNKIVLFAPDGSSLYTYVKTKSWYATGSDGVLKVAKTPYGTIGSAICFDMDFPSFVHRLGTEKADIVLVPAFDRPLIRPFHTEVGLLRGIENGFSVIRQTNEGTSEAIDGSGRILAQQDFYATSERVMLADVPTQRVPTLYRVLGEWFAYLGMALALALCAWGIMAGKRKKADQV